MHADQDSHAAVLGMATAYWSAGVVYALARFGIADLLAGEPRDTASIAAEAGVRTDPLGRFLRAGAHLGLLDSESAGSWQLTSRGALLRSDAPGSLRDTVL